MLSGIEARLRPLLPADLYAQTWVDPSAENLIRVFEYLRTLQRILSDYTPRVLTEHPVAPGTERYQWYTGSLMFTDLAGFTRLLEANSRMGREGADALLDVLNRYFSAVIELIGKSSGELLEFTGDALLVAFDEEGDGRGPVVMAQAVRAGLRMQRAMRQFERIQTPAGEFSLGMRIGIHRGRYLSADIGTPQRMEHVLLGDAVRDAKLTESNGQVGRVCLSSTAYDLVQDQFAFEQGNPEKKQGRFTLDQVHYQLVVDDPKADLGDFDLTLTRRKMGASVLIDRGSKRSLVKSIRDSLPPIESLSSFLPDSVLDLLIRSAADRERIPPDFPEPTVVFVNFLGLPELLHKTQRGKDEEQQLMDTFSRAFALINAAVETHGGVLKKVTYHLSGSDIVIYFGAPVAHTDDPLRAIRAAIEIREIIQKVVPPEMYFFSYAGIDRSEVVKCQIGIARGPAFSAEIGEPRGRREFNVLGDTVNTAARLMNRAGENEILMTSRVYDRVRKHFVCKFREEVSLKGKAAPVKIYALKVPEET